MDRGTSSKCTAAGRAALVALVARLAEACELMTTAELTIAPMDVNLRGDDFWPCIVRVHLVFTTGCRDAGGPESNEVRGVAQPFAMAELQREIVIALCVRSLAPFSPAGTVAIEGEQVRPSEDPLSACARSASLSARCQLWKRETLSFMSLPLATFFSSYFGSAKPARWSAPVPAFDLRLEAAVSDRRDERSDVAVCCTSRDSRPSSAGAQ